MLFSSGHRTKSQIAVSFSAIGEDLGQSLHQQRGSILANRETALKPTWVTCGCHMQIHLES